jgi:hypothetical protein
MQSGIEARSGWSAAVLGGGIAERFLGGLGTEWTSFHDDRSFKPLICGNIIWWHSPAPPEMISRALATRRSRVRVPKATPRNTRSHNP